MGFSKQKNKLNGQRQSGLTLIEVMIAVAIIGILAVIALPSFNSVIKQNPMRLVVDTVVGDFRQSEILAQAAGAGQSVLLEIANPGASWTYTVTHGSSGSVLTRQASDFSGAISLSVTGSDFSDADSDGNRDVTFNQLKRIDSAGAGTLVITLSDISIEVVRNIVGMVSACSGIAGDDGCIGNGGRLSISLVYKPWEFLRANTEFRCAHLNRDVGGGSKL